MRPLDFIRSIFSKPLPPDATVSSPEFAEMQNATHLVISGANTITAEINKIERALRAQRGK